MSFFFNLAATTEIYTLSLHDALPISNRAGSAKRTAPSPPGRCACASRSEEHTSELQSQFQVVCRLLLEKKNDASSPLGQRGISKLSSQPSIFGGPIRFWTSLTANICIINRLAVNSRA